MNKRYEDIAYTLLETPGFFYSFHKIHALTRFRLPDEDVKQVMRLMADEDFQAKARSHYKTKLPSDLAEAALSRIDIIEKWPGIIPMTLTIQELPSTVPAEKGEIIAYEPPKRIAWTKLVEDTWYLGRNVKKVHIGTVSGKPAWSDGHVMEVGEPPARLKALKKYYEVYGPDEKPRDFDHLLPDIPPGSPVVEPLATIIGNGFRYQDVSVGTRPDIVYLSNAVSPRRRDPETHEICAQKKYIDYFKVNYPLPEFIMVSPTHAIVVKYKNEIVGLIMPIKVDPREIEHIRRFMEAKVPPVEPPPAPPVGPPSKPYPWPARIRPEGR